MSDAARSWAWEIPIKGPKKIILVLIAHYTDENGRCRLPVSQIATLTGRCQRTVQISIRELERLGFLETRRSIGSCPNEYRVAGGSQ